MSLDKTTSIRDNLLSNSEEKTEEFFDFLPFSRIKGLYDTHPLMKAMNLNHMEVHRCLTFILRKYRETKRENVSENHNNKTTIHKCIECKSMKVVTDTKQGFRFCGNCGVCLPGIIYGESFIEATQTQHSNTKNELPKWIIAKNTYSDTWSDVQISIDADHWNHYANFNSYDLDEIKHFASWVTKRASNEQRIASAFMFKYILKNHDIEELTSEENKEFNITYKEPDYISSCQTCNEKFSTMFQKRHHKCTNKTKRPQISLVKNKKQRIQYINPM